MPIAKYVGHRISIESIRIFSAIGGRILRTLYIYLIPDISLGTPFICEDLGLLRVERFLPYVRLVIISTIPANR